MGRNVVLDERLPLVYDRRMCYATGTKVFMNDKATHCVTVPLKTDNIWNVELRLEEITSIMMWIDELVSWDKEMYETKYRASMQAVDVWFVEESHAMLCALRWL